MTPSAATTWKHLAPNPKSAYIDEDTAARVLVRLLQKAGHDVEIPIGPKFFARSVQSA
jgi:hypothetical protein